MRNNNSYIIIVSMSFLASCSDGGSNSSIDENIFVYDTREVLQCAPDIITPEESAQVLINNGVDVISSTCGNRTGVAVPTVCGASALTLLVHEVRIESLVDAEEAGFLDIETLVDDSNQTGYELVEC